jgi:hypothetical protein
LGACGWSRIAKEIPGRTARQVRERWKNYLAPELNTGPWTEAENALLSKLVAQYGSQWSRMARYFANRTDISLKNHWVLLKRREVRQMQQVALAIVRQQQLEEVDNGGQRDLEVSTSEVSDETVGEVEDETCGLLLNNLTLDFEFQMEWDALYSC